MTTATEMKERILSRADEDGEFRAQLITDPRAAISAETGVTSWIYEQPAGVASLMVTDGGLLFGGDAAGRFRALDLTTGEVLWETDLGAQVSGYPVTYAVADRQYVAVSTGSSFALGELNSLVSEELQAGVDTNLFIFALPD